MINKIKNSGTEFYHGNLKPSNIFYNENEGEIEWKITDFGIPSLYPNKYYKQPLMEYNMSLSKTNVSFMSENYEAELYTLGVILL